MFFFDHFYAAPKVFVGRDKVVGKHALDCRNDWKIQFGRFAAQKYQKNK